MRTLFWSKAFARAFKRLRKGRPELRQKVERALQLLAEDPSHPELHIHKLKGRLAGVWACTVGYDHRILFEVVSGPDSGDEEIVLLTMGSHDEVY